MSAAQPGNSLGNSNNLRTTEVDGPKNGSRLKKRLCIALITFVLVVSDEKLLVAAGSVEIIPNAVGTNQTTNFTFTNSHYAKGSTQPIIPDDGILRFYSMRFCPYSHRVHLVLNAKNIPYHVLYINLSEKPEWYTKVNPNGKVPAVQLVNEPYAPFLSESLIICEYLDEKYPDVHLYPRDPFDKAQTKIWIERFGPVAASFHRLVFEKNADDVNDKLLSDLYAGLKPYEDELTKRGSDYFGGQNPNILDYAIWPWFERFGILSSIFGEKFQFDHNNFPSLVKWATIMKDDEAVAKHHLPTNTHTKFSLERHEGIPNYNILVDEP